MVANSDLQIWQDAVKGINETGKTTLTQEEWAALAVLNECLSSGDFSTDDSRRSYQALNEKLNSYGNHPALHTHLYNFIALCYKYAAVQPASARHEISITAVNQPMPSENKPTVTLRSILFGAKGALSKNLKFAIICLLAAVVLAGIIYTLNVYTNMPGYVTALVVGALAGIALLRKNQNGQIREKLAFVGATAAGVYIYFRNGGQISGGSAFVWTFLAVGLILSFINKNKPKLMVWLAEVAPAALCFLAFERLGGAISGFGAKDMVLGNLASVRYVEAFKIFLLFCLFQSFANNAIVAQYRERVRSLWRNLLFYGSQAAVILLLLCVSLNPFKLPLFDSVKSELIAFSQPVRAGADVFDATGNKLGSATKTPISSALLCEHIPGYLATAYAFSYDGNFDTARITFRYDAGLGAISERFLPRIYYFNETDGTLEELPNQKVYASDDGGWISVTAKTTHFSVYMLLNSVEYNSVWSAEIRRPAETDPCSCISSADVPVTAVNFDVVFVIDESGSMNQNDRNRLRVEAAKQFVDMLAEDSPQNRVAIYGFENRARFILKLTALNDKEAVKTSLNSIHSGGGTNIFSGLQAAVQEIEANNHSYTPVVILMTDGQDNSKLTNYSPLIDRANAKGITVFTIGLGKDVNSTLLRQISDNTGGGVYYYAENSDVLPSIFKSANAAIIEYEKDSNGDGISDYFAQLLNDGTLRLSNGSGQFKGIDWVNCPADLDGDGLLNGEELVITGKIVNGAMQVFVDMKSDPTKKDDKATIEKSVKKIPTEHLASFAKAAYDDNLYGNSGRKLSVGTCDYYLICSEQQGKGNLATDFWYQIYKAETGDFVIAFRGTPTFASSSEGEGALAVGNWVETLGLIISGFHSQDLLIRNEIKNGKISGYLKEAKNTNKKIYLTGHSLGGHLAIIAHLNICQSEEYRNLVEKVETFNAVGISIINHAIIKNTDKITQHYICCDIARWASLETGLGFPGTSKEATLSSPHRCPTHNNLGIVGVSGTIVKDLIIFISKYIADGIFGTNDSVYIELLMRVEAHKLSNFSSCPVKMDNTMGPPALPK